MTDTASPEGANEMLAALAGVFAGNRQHRAERAATALNTLRPFERRIVREAAVMGYVLGRQDGMIRGRQGGLDDGSDFPHDRDILRDVIEHCDSTDDLYPYLTAACEGRRRRVTMGRMWPGEATS